MKKIACFVCMLFLMMTVVCLPSVLAAEVDYAGNWICMYVDFGDGALLSEYEGQTLKDTIYFDLQPDGTFLLTSFGMEQAGAWQPTSTGVSLTADGIEVPFSYTDGQLINSEDGVTMYFTKAGENAKQGGFSTLVNLGKNNAAPSFSFAGQWHAVSYTAMGDGKQYRSDIPRRSDDYACGGWLGPGTADR